MVTEEQYNNMVTFKKVPAICVDGNVLRVMKEESGDVFVFSKGKSRRGWRKSKDDFCRLYTLKEVKPNNNMKNAKWHQRIQKAIACLESSGLWQNCEDGTDFLVYFKNLDKMTWEDKETINSLHCNVKRQYHTIGESKEEELRINEHNRKEVKRVYGDFVDKYPFIFPEDGSVDTDYLWDFSDVRLKTMNWGCHEGYHKELIENALADKRSYSTGRVIVKYDNSFEYNAEKNKAWYSEEYRNCGDGYYYLALDANTAIYYDKD